MRIKYLVFSGLISIASLMMMLLIFEISLAAAEASQEMSTNGEWIDQFDKTTLDSRWEWLYEDPSHWSLSEQPGYLRIVTQQGSLLFGGAKNVLLTTPTLENYRISTKVDFQPTELVQQASLLIYQDDENFLQLGYRYIGDHAVTFRIETPEDSQATNITATATTMYLRIKKFHNSYVGEYSIDGNTWFEVDRFNVQFSNAKVGLNVQNGPSTTDIPADYDYFEFNEPGVTFYVAPQAECGDVEPCYATIQQAVADADTFDTIKVASGTYTDLFVFPRDDVTTTGVVTQVVYLTKSLTLQGGYSPLDWETSDPQDNPTTLDAQGKGRVIYVAGDINPSIQGFTITGGDASGLGGADIWDGDAGGGIYFWGSPVTLIYNHVISNTAEVGGGIYGKGPDSEESDEDCWIIDNSIISNMGGGISMSGGNTWIYGNDVHHNQDGGMDFFVGSHQLHNNLIHNNKAFDGGGGVGFQWSQATLVNNLIAGNVLEDNEHGHGAAIANFGGSLKLIHNTIARNTGGDGSGIENWSGLDVAPFTATINLTNTIIVSQAIGIIVDDVSTVMIDSILWHNVPITVSQSPTAVVSVKNEYSGDPLFAADGYHITAGSAAIDMGIDAGVTVDIDGEPRPSAAGYDLGADELWIVVYLPMVTNK